MCRCGKRVVSQGPIFDPLPIPQSDDDSRGGSRTRSR